MKIFHPVTMFLISSCLKHYPNKITILFQTPRFVLLVFIYHVLWATMLAVFRKGMASTPSFGQLVNVIL